MLYGNILFYFICLNPIKNPGIRFHGLFRAWLYSVTDWLYMSMLLERMDFDVCSSELPPDIMWFLRQAASWFSALFTVSALIRSSRYTVRNHSAKNDTVLMNANTQAIIVTMSIPPFLFVRLKKSEFCHSIWAKRNEEL